MLGPFFNPHFLRSKKVIVTTIEQFSSIVAGWSGLIACDTETFGSLNERMSHPRLLGIALAPERTSNDVHAIYIPHSVFINGSWLTEQNDIIGHSEFREWLVTHLLVGHNFTYDQKWVDLNCNVTTMWVADTRIMWHLASAPAGPFGYGLKDAQVSLLGWKDRGDKELELQVKSRGGSLKRGDHYLADLEILSKYACLDVIATMEVYKKLKPWFDTHDYMPLLRSMMAYNELLEVNSGVGVRASREGLERALKRLKTVRDTAMRKLNENLEQEIGELEADWADRHAAKYKREANRTRYLNDRSKWTKFNWNSDAHKRELFYEKLGQEVVYTTESGKPSTDTDSVKMMRHHFRDLYLRYNEIDTLINNFVQPYIECISSAGRIHPGFNICGTVSYRLSGFKPYLLNAPFSQKIVMKNFICDEGYVGIHMDLAAIEPTITAHYSEDKALLKVFRDGLGDIYLDLARDIFPTNKELQDGYDPRVPISSKIKRQFETERSVAKVVQLAVQYTGTGHTVSRKLTQSGIDTSVEQATDYVRAYWRKFRRVAEWQYQLREVNRRDGHLRNVIGRIIRVPDPEYKDLPNRFVQSSAHDVLILIVLEIERLNKERNAGMLPVLIDCHDSTSWQAPMAHKELALDIFRQALYNINQQLALSVQVKMELKTFKTLAGLKGDD